RKQRPEIYSQIPASIKATILCARLRRSGTCNEWGWLGQAAAYDGEPALALMSVGRVALVHLRPILDDHRPIPKWGTRTIASMVHKYRCCEFAYRYASLSLGLTPQFDLDPDDRDKEIDKLKVTLDKMIRRDSSPK